MTERGVEVILDRIGMNPVFRMLLIAACLGYVLDALNNSLLGYTMPLMAMDFHIDSTTQGYLLSAALWGGVLGQLIWGWLAEKRGRLFAFQGTILTFAAFTGFTAIAWSPMAIFVTRFIAGSGLAGFTPVDSVMVSEFSPTRQRGRYTGVIAVLWPVGAMLGVGASIYVLPRVGWRLLFLLGIPPAILVWIVRRGVPESPRWLIKQGRLVDALQSLRRLGATDEMLHESGDAPYESIVHQGLLGDLFTSRQIRKTAVAWSLWVANLYASMSLIAWLPSLFVQVHGFTLNASLRYTFAATIAGFIGRLSGVYLLEAIGRRASLGYSLFLAGSCMLAFGYVHRHYLLLAALIGFYFFNELAGVCQIAYIPELFPTNMRMKGNAWSSATARVAAATSPVLVGYLLARKQYSLIAVIFSLSLFLPWLIFTAWGPETKGKGLVEATAYPKP
jgi:putative MFS transporter